MDDFIVKVVEFNNYKNSKTQFKVFTVITEENFEYLKSLKENLAVNGVELDLQRLKIERKPVKYSDEIEAYLKQGKDDNQATRITKLDDKEVYGASCNAGYKFLRVAPNGDVKKCHTEQKGYDMGNIVKRTFKQYSKPMPCRAERCICPAIVLSMNALEGPLKPKRFRIPRPNVKKVIKKVIKNILLNKK